MDNDIDDVDMTCPPGSPGGSSFFSTCSSRPADVEPPTLPPRPQKETNEYEKAPGKSSRPRHWPTLMFALDQGLPQLAEAISEIHEKNWTSKNPFQKREETVRRVSTILHGVSPALLKIAIEGKLHEVWERSDPALKLPGRHAAPTSTGWRPVIYALVHCSKSGELPSRAQYETVLDVMEEYITEQNSPNAWHKANKTAAKIDMASFPGRRWNTNYSKPPRSRNFRRYNTKTNTKRIQEFIAVFRRELQACPNQRKHEPLTRSRVYIGWTVHEATRCDQHYAHSGKSSQVAYLLEAAFAVTFPTLDIFLRSLTVQNVLEAADAPFSEHAWSILTGSYVEFGGLNGTLGGNGGMGTTAAKAPPETWAYAAEGTMNQGVLDTNMTKSKQNIKDWKLLKRYADDGSELAAYEEAVLSRDEAEDECRDKVEELKTACKIHGQIGVQYIEKQKKIADQRMKLARLRGFQQMLQDLNTSARNQLSLVPSQESNTTMETEAHSTDFRQSEASSTSEEE